MENQTFQLKCNKDSRFQVERLKYGGILARSFKARIVLLGFIVRRLILVFLKERFNPIEFEKVKIQKRRSSVLTKTKKKLFNSNKMSVSENNCSFLKAFKFNTSKCELFFQSAHSNISSSSKIIFLDMTSSSYKKQEIIKQLKDQNRNLISKNNYLLKDFESLVLSISKSIGINHWALYFQTNSHLKLNKYVTPRILVKFNTSKNNYNTIKQVSERISKNAFNKNTTNLYRSNWLCRFYSDTQLTINIICKQNLSPKCRNITPCQKTIDTSIDSAYQTLNTSFRNSKDSRDMTYFPNILENSKRFSTEEPILLSKSTTINDNDSKIIPKSYYPHNPNSSYWKLVIPANLKLDEIESNGSKSLFPFYHGQIDSCFHEEANFVHHFTNSAIHAHTPPPIKETLVAPTANTTPTPCIISPSYKQTPTPSKEFPPKTFAPLMKLDSNNEPNQIEHFDTFKPKQQRVDSHPSHNFNLQDNLTQSVNTSPQSIFFPPQNNVLCKNKEILAYQPSYETSLSELKALDFDFNPESNKNFSKESPQSLLYQSTYETKNKTTPYPTPQVIAPEKKENNKSSRISSFLSAFNTSLKKKISTPINLKYIKQFFCVAKDTTSPSSKCFSHLPLKRRKLVSTLLILFIITICLSIFALLFTYVILPKLVQTNIEDTNIILHKASLYSPDGNQGFTMDLIIGLISPSAIPATLLPSNMSVYWKNDRHLGEMAFPQLSMNSQSKSLFHNFSKSSLTSGSFPIEENKLKASLNDQILYVNSTPSNYASSSDSLDPLHNREINGYLFEFSTYFKLTNFSNWELFLEDLIANGTTEWNLHSTLKLKLLGFQLNGVNLSKNLVISDPTRPVSTTTTQMLSYEFPFEMIDFDLSHSTESDAIVAIDIQMISDGTTQIDPLGNIDFNIFYLNEYMGSIYGKNLSIIEGINRFQFKGFLDPYKIISNVNEDDRYGKEIKIQQSLSSLMSRTISKKPVTISAFGVNGSVPLYSAAIKELRYEVPLKNIFSNTGDVIRGISIEKFDILPIANSTNNFNIDGILKIDLFNPFGPNSPLFIEKATTSADMIHENDSQCLYLGQLLGQLKPIGNPKHAEKSYNTPEKLQSDKLEAIDNYSLIPYTISYEIEGTPEQIITNETTTNSESYRTSILEYLFFFDGMISMEDNGAALSEFVQQLIESRTVELSLVNTSFNAISSSVLGQIPLVNLTLDSSLTMDGFGGSDSININSLDFTGISSNGSWIFQTEINIDSPASTSVFLGDISIEMQYKNSFVGEIFSQDIYINNGQNSILAKGRIQPSKDDLEIISALFSDFLSNSSQSNLNVTIYQQEQDKALFDPRSVSFIRDGLNGMTMEIKLPSLNTMQGNTQLLSQVHLDSLGLDLTKMVIENTNSNKDLHEELVYSFPFKSEVKVIFTNPLGPHIPLDIVQLDISTNILNFNKTFSDFKPFGNFINSVVSTSLKQSFIKQELSTNGQDFSQYAISFPIESKILVTDFEQFSDFTSSYISQKKVKLALEGNARAIVNTSLGQLDIQSIPIYNEIFMTGLNSFKDSKVISLAFNGIKPLISASEQFDYEQGLHMTLLIRMYNPSDAIVSLEKVSLLLLYEDKIIGIITSDNFELYSGNTEVEFNGGFYLNPETEESLSNLFSRALAGYDINIKTKPYDNGSMPKWIETALKNINLVPYIPPLSELGTSFDEIIENMNINYLNLSTGRNNPSKLLLTGQSKVSVNNPFGNAKMTIGKIGFSSSLFHTQEYLGFMIAESVTPREVTPNSLIKNSSLELIIPLRAQVDLSDGGYAFGKLVNLFLNSSEEMLKLRLDGIAYARVDLADGKLSLSDIPISQGITIKSDSSTYESDTPNSQVHSSPQSLFNGVLSNFKFNGINDNNNLEVFADYELINPSIVSIVLPPINFQILYNDLIIGTITTELDADIKALYQPSLLALKGELYKSKTKEDSNKFSTLISKVLKSEYIDPSQPEPPNHINAIPILNDPSLPPWLQIGLNNFFLEQSLDKIPFSAQGLFKSLDFTNLTVNLKIPEQVEIFGMLHLQLINPFGKNAHISIKDFVFDGTLAYAELWSTIGDLHSSTITISESNEIPTADGLSIKLVTPFHVCLYVKNYQNLANFTQNLFSKSDKKNLIITGNFSTNVSTPLGPLYLQSIPLSHFLPFENSMLFSSLQQLSLGNLKLLNYSELPNHSHNSFMHPFSETLSVTSLQTIFKIPRKQSANAQEQIKLYIPDISYILYMDEMIIGDVKLSHGLIAPDENLKAVITLRESYSESLSNLETSNLGFFYSSLLDSRSQLTLKAASEQPGMPSWFKSVLPSFSIPNLSGVSSLKLLQDVKISNITLELMPESSHLQAQVLINIKNLMGEGFNLDLQAVSGSFTLYSINDIPIASIELTNTKVLKQDINHYSWTFYLGLDDMLVIHNNIDSISMLLKSFNTLTKLPANNDSNKLDQSLLYLGGTVAIEAQSDVGKISAKNIKVLNMMELGKNFFNSTNTGLKDLFKITNAQIDKNYSNDKSHKGIKLDANATITLPIDISLKLGETTLNLKLESIPIGKIVIHPFEMKHGSSSLSLTVLISLNSSDLTDFSYYISKIIQGDFSVKIGLLGSESNLSDGSKPEWLLSIIKQLEFEVPLSSLSTLINPNTFGKLLENLNILDISINEYRSLSHENQRIMVSSLIEITPSKTLMEILQYSLIESDFSLSIYHIQYLNQNNHFRKSNELSHSSPIKNASTHISSGSFDKTFTYDSLSTEDPVFETKSNNLIGTFRGHTANIDQRTDGSAILNIKESQFELPDQGLVLSSLFNEILNPQGPLELHIKGTYNIKLNSNLGLLTLQNLPISTDFSYDIINNYSRNSNSSTMGLISDYQISDFSISDMHFPKIGHSFTLKAKFSITGTQGISINLSTLILNIFSKDVYLGTIMLPKFILSPTTQQLELYSVIKPKSLSALAKLITKFTTGKPISLKLKGCSLEDIPLQHPLPTLETSKTMADAAFYLSKSELPMELWLAHSLEKFELEITFSKEVSDSNSILGQSFGKLNLIEQIYLEDLKINMNTPRNPLISGNLKLIYRLPRLLAIDIKIQEVNTKLLAFIEYSDSHQYLGFTKINSLSPTSDGPYHADSNELIQRNLNQAIFAIDDLELTIPESQDSVMIDFLDKLMNHDGSCTLFLKGTTTVTVSTLLGRMELEEIPVEIPREVHFMADLLNSSSVKMDNIDIIHGDSSGLLIGSQILFQLPEDFDLNIDLGSIFLDMQIPISYRDLGSLHHHIQPLSSYSESNGWKIQCGLINSPSIRLNTKDSIHNLPLSSVLLPPFYDNNNNYSPIGPKNIISNFISSISQTIEATGSQDSSHNTFVTQFLQKTIINVPLRADNLSPLIREIRIRIRMAIFIPIVMAESTIHNSFSVPITIINGEMDTYDQSDNLHGSSILSYEIPPVIPPHTTFTLPATRVSIQLGGSLQTLQSLLYGESNYVKIRGRLTVLLGDYKTEIDLAVDNVKLKF